MEKKIVLFVDACISCRPNPRTPRLCRAFLDHLKKLEATAGIELQLETVTVRSESVMPLNEISLQQREAFVQNHDYTSPMFNLAKQFAKADFIIIGAPYWDLSFPAVLKAYAENITVSGLTFASTPTGLTGLCKAKRLFYLTTAGGIIGDRNLGFDYMRELGKMLGIADFRCFYADGLDLDGNDADAILNRSIQEITALDADVLFS